MAAGLEWEDRDFIKDLKDDIKEAVHKGLTLQNIIDTVYYDAIETAAHCHTYKVLDYCKVEDINLIEDYYGAKIDTLTNLAAQALRQRVDNTFKIEDYVNNLRSKQSPDQMLDYLIGMNNSFKQKITNG